MKGDTKNTLVRMVTLTVLTAGLFGTCYLLDTWAAAAFAQPIMGAALVGVVEVGVLLLFLMLAPPVSWLFSRLFKVPRES